MSGQECLLSSLSLYILQNGASPLYVASQNGHTDIVDVLVKAGADVHQAFDVIFF